jgi:hypothetical protein
VLLSPEFEMYAIHLRKRSFQGRTRLLDSIPPLEPVCHFLDQIKNPPEDRGPESAWKWSVSLPVRWKVYEQRPWNLSRRDPDLLVGGNMLAIKTNMSSYTIAAKDDSPARLGYSYPYGPFFFLAMVTALSLLLLPNPPRNGRVSTLSVQERIRRWES